MYLRGRRELHITYVAGLVVQDEKGVRFEILHADTTRDARAIKLVNLKTGHTHWTGWWYMGKRYVVATNQQKATQ